MPDQIIAELPKNSKETIRVSLTEFKGHQLIDLRIFYKDGEEMKPGKGITVRRDMISDLKKALIAAEKADKTEKGSARDSSVENDTK